MDLSGSRCGVYVGCGQGDYSERSGKQGLTAQALLGNSSAILSARISYHLNLKGACLAIDTACSSSLVALAEACDSLLLHRNDIALAGGVCVLAGPGLHVMASKAGMLSKHGRCFTFDSRADGFVPGEGVGVVLLKRLNDAVSDGDTIVGVIRGWGVNQDGRTNGITAPSAKSQTELQARVYERFGIDPQTISLVEAHGTATPLGDPIEVEALTHSFRVHTQKTGYCALGSVKSNIGHLLAAAGISGLIKTLLSLRYGMLPPTIHFENLNEHVVLDESPFYVNTALQPWDGPTPRRAAINSFGFSGTNAHVVLEEWRAPAAAEVRRDQPVLLVLSAKSRAQLERYALELQLQVERDESLDLVAAAYTLQTGREAMGHRAAFLVKTREQLLEALLAFSRGGTAPHIFVGQANGPAGLAILERDEDANTLVDTWIRNGKWSNLAELWVRGLKVDWRKLYEGVAQPRRVSLPTYPFARERYWIGDTLQADRYEVMSFEERWEACPSGEDVGKSSGMK